MHTIYQPVCFGSEQTCPHPLLQHFCAPEQSLSDVHCSTQIPNVLGSTAGQLPGLTSPTMVKDR